MSKKIAKRTISKTRNSKGLGLFVKFILIPNSRKNSFMIVCRIMFLNETIEISTGIRIKNRDDFLREPLKITEDESQTALINEFSRLIENNFLPAAG